MGETVTYITNYLKYGNLYNGLLPYLIIISDHISKNRSKVTTFQNNYHIGYYIGLYILRHGNFTDKKITI